jgi:hypothetical protein
LLEVLTDQSGSTVLFTPVAGWVTKVTQLFANNQKHLSKWDVDFSFTLEEGKINDITFTLLYIKEKREKKKSGPLVLVERT